MSASNVQGWEIHRALRKPHAGRKDARHGAVATYRKGYPIPFAAGHQVGQVKGIDVVAFDDVRITFPQLLDQCSQHGLFRTLTPIEDALPAAIIRQSDEDDLILRTLRVRE